MNTDAIVVMSYQEKLWWDFVDAHPYLIMWSIGILVAFLVIAMASSFFKKRY